MDDTSLPADHPENMAHDDLVHTTDSGITNEDKTITAKERHETTYHSGVSEKEGKSITSNMSNEVSENTGPRDGRVHIKDIHMRTEDQITGRKARVIVKELEGDEVYSSDIESNNEKTNDLDTQVLNSIQQSVIQSTNRMKMLKIGGRSG